MSNFYKRKTLDSILLHMLLHYMMTIRPGFKCFMLTKIKGGGCDKLEGEGVSRSPFVRVKCPQHFGKKMNHICCFVIYHSFCHKAKSKIAYISAIFRDRELRFAENVGHLILAKLSSFSTPWMNSGLRPELIPEPR